jgi:oligopeptide transport system substrate-binding protein
MGKNISRIFTLLLCVLMSFSIVACGGNSTQQTSDDPTQTEGNQTPTGTADKILDVHIDVEVFTLDPQIATDGTSFEVIAAFTEGLFSIDKDGNTIPAMAESYEKSPDGLTYTFKIRDTAWSNGTPVTANDFVYAWRRVVDPVVASEYSFIIGVAGVKNADDIVDGKTPVDQLGVSAVDDKTLKVELDYPVTFFESLMTFPSFYPLNEAFHTTAGNNFGTSPSQVIANGPFLLTAYEPHTTSISLERNPSYWDSAKVQIDGIRYQVIKDSQQTMLSYQNGDLDIATLSGEQAEQFASDPEFTPVAAGYLWYLSPNQTVKGLENLNLRKAIALSYDKNAVVNNILKDGSTIADFAVPKNLATGPDGKDFRETASTYLSTDKEAAKQFYEAAKSELGVDSFKYTLIVEDTESAINVAQFLQAEIQTNLPGFTIELQQMPKDNRVARMQSGDYELGLTRWGPDYADPMTYLNMWITNSPNNYGHWSNPDYDALISNATSGALSLDPTARWDALKNAEKIVMDDVVIIPVYQKGNAEMIKSNVKGIEFHSVGINRIYKNVTIQ